MYEAREALSGAVIARRLRPAHTHWTRLRGLLGTARLEPGEGLWLKPCRQVHMIGMRYPIDVVFLDDGGRVVHAIGRLAPGKLSPRVREAESVLELPAGTLDRHPLAVGARIEIDGAGDAAPESRIEALGRALCNVALASFYLFFAAAHFTAGLRTGNWATLLPIVAQESLLMVLFLTRRRTISSSSRPLDWAIGITGTFLPLLMRPAAEPSALVWLGQPVQVAGLLLAVAAVACLGRSIGIVAANRGIMTGGLYRVVRHPLYVAHIIGFAGYVVSYPTPENALLTAATTIALVMRAVVEERFLEGDPAYRAYRERTRWRFVPYVH